MGSLSTALELLRNLVARLGAANSADDGAATAMSASQVDAKLHTVLRALSRAVGGEDAAHMVHSALFTAWHPVAARGACVTLWHHLCVAEGALTILGRCLHTHTRTGSSCRSSWPAWPASAAVRGDAAVSTEGYSSLIARHPILIVQLVDHLMCATTQSSVPTYFRPVPVRSC